MSQCVSCNNQPNDNDSLGGGEHEGAVTPMVVGIIVGTVVVFVLVLCALFYCAKLETDKARRSLKAEVDDNLAVETDGGDHIRRPYEQHHEEPRTAPPPPPHALNYDEGVEVLDGDDDDECEPHRHRRRPKEEDEDPRQAKSRPVERRPSSVTVVAGEMEDPRCGVGAGNDSSWIPSTVVGGKKKGLFRWGGGKKSNGRATPGDNPPVTAIEMV